MLCVTSESGKGAAARQSITAPFQADYQTGYANAISEPLTALEKLRQQFLVLGYSLHQLVGDELAIYGPGLGCAAFPDFRATTVYLRDLRKGVV